nr:MAG TPA: protein of unknown function DUF3330 [Caudoviricetes sp.]
MARCKICHVESPLDRSGRCESCIDATEATSLGLHYGDYIARKERGTLPHTPRRDRFAAALLDYEKHVELPKCRICGGNVFPPRRFLCSPKCEAEDKRRKSRHRTDENPRLCPVCGKDVGPNLRKTYCSWECYRQNAKRLDARYRERKRAEKKGNVE